MNNKLLVIGALLLSLNASAAELKKPACKITDEMKLAISMMCSLEPNPSNCEAEAIAKRVNNEVARTFNDCLSFFSSHCTSG